MPSQPDYANLNLEHARELRASGMSYREIGHTLNLTANQLRRIRRVLSRTKAAATRLRRGNPDATDRDLPVGHSALPPGLRQSLKAAGFRTLGDLVDAIADPDFEGLETLAGIGPYRARLVAGLLDQLGLMPGTDNLQAAVELLFPELGDVAAVGSGKMPKMDAPKSRTGAVIALRRPR